jgi:hypothetical protein
MCFATLTKGTQVMATKAATAATMQEPAPAKATKVKAAPVVAKPDKAKQVTEAAKPVVVRDTFGCRAGSQAATINARIAAQPQTAKAIADACGLQPGRVYAHLRSLVAKGHAQHSEAGYSVVPPEKPAKRAK